MENSSSVANHTTSTHTTKDVQSVNIPLELLDKIPESIRNDIVKWDEERCREIEELMNRSAQMEKTMKWWSDCTANWREKWGKVRAERNRAREQCKNIQSKMEAIIKECACLRYDRQDLVRECNEFREEIAKLRGIPLSSITSRRTSKASCLDLDSCSYPEPSEGSEPSLKSELYFIEDVLRTSEQNYNDSPPLSIESVPTRDNTQYDNKTRDNKADKGRVSRSSIDRRASQSSRCDERKEGGGVDLKRLKHLLEETQRLLHEEKHSKIAVSQSLELYSKENVLMKKKLEDYKRQRSEALNEVSRIELESGDKLARMSLKIEGENESREELDKKIKEMRSDVQRLEAENATEWARRERLETEKCALERENKNLKLQIQEAEETICRRNTNPVHSNEYKTLQADMYERNKELEILRNTHTRIKKQFSEKSDELEHCQKRLQTLEEEVFSLRKRVEDLKKELLTREDEVDMRNNQVRKLQRSVDELNDYNDTLTSQMCTLETRLRQRTDAMFNPSQRSKLTGGVLSEDEDEED